MKVEELMDKAVKFHGHSCPGLIIGVLASKYILDNGNDFSIDEELVAVVENDNCSVDAIQALLGTTFGKGNLKYLDHGKNNYSFYNRTSNKAVKLSIKARSFGERDISREERLEILLNSNPENIFEIKEIEYKPPNKAEIHKSLACDDCGEPTMSTRLLDYEDKKLCIPCHEKLNK
jgi:formylmethanofuran dehydrogenase subunit E